MGWSQHRIIPRIIFGSGKIHLLDAAVPNNHNAMISSEGAAPKTVKQGFKVEDVAAGKDGQQLHFWVWNEQRISQPVN